MDSVLALKPALASQSTDLAALNGVTAVILMLTVELVACLHSELVVLMALPPVRIVPVTFVNSSSRSKCDAFSQYGGQTRTFVHKYPFLFLHSRSLVVGPR
jgi:hypothetical protein